MGLKDSIFRRTGGPIIRHTISLHDYKDGNFVEDSDPFLGRTVSRYRILEKIGAGGMGVVYKAEDSLLGRFVALKFLSEVLVHNQRALERFRFEARAASLLNHPNICTIYDVGEDNGQQFIAMEYLDGQTLNHRISRTPLPFSEVLQIGIQTVDALAAAHAQGIIHRDIKPANIFITKQGSVKVLDFGIAKVLTQPEATRLTTDGAPLGTVSYMSPEQVRTEELDARSDLFSFGVVLYEMATGALPFQGQSVGVIFEAILNRTPTSSIRLNPTLPPKLEEIIQIALEKDRNLRYQHAIDLGAELRRLERNTDSVRQDNRTAGLAARPMPSWSRSRYAIGFVGAMLLCVSVMAVYYQRRKSHPSVDPARRERIERQVTFLGNAYFPAISPDGRSVAYWKWPTNGAVKLVVQDLSSGANLDVLTLEKPGYWLRWSPDGSEIATSGSPKGVEENYGLIVSRLGGGARRLSLMGNVGCWTSDGSQVLNWGSSSDNSVSWISKATGAEKDIPVPAYDSLLDIDCSTKSDRLLLLTKRSGKSVIWSMKPDGTDQRNLFESTGIVSGIRSVRWSPEEDSIYCLRYHEGTTDLLKLSILNEALKPTVLASGLESGQIFALSGDASKLAYTREHAIWSLWSVRLSQSPDGAKVFKKQVTSGTWTPDCPSVSPDGRWVAFAINDSDIYRIPIDGGEPLRLTFFNQDGYATNPVWSPDGRRIAFIRQDKGRARKIWVVDVDGTHAHALDKTDATSTEVLAWSPSRKILYGKSPSGKLGGELSRVDVETQQEESITLEGMMIDSAPAIAPDGKKIAIAGVGSSGAGLYVISLGGQSERELHEGVYVPLSWSTDSRFVYAVRILGDSQELVQIYLGDTKKVKPIKSLPEDFDCYMERLSRGCAISLDGRTLIGMSAKTQSDVWIMQDFDPEIPSANSHPSGH